MIDRVETFVISCWAKFQLFSLLFELFKNLSQIAATVIGCCYFLETFLVNICTRCVCVCV